MIEDYESEEMRGLRNMENLLQTFSFFLLLPPTIALSLIYPREALFFYCYDRLHAPSRQ
jgi:hypothetical protein